MIKDAKPLRRPEAIEELNLYEEMEKMHFPPIVGFHSITVHRLYCKYEWHRVGVRPFCIGIFLFVKRRNTAVQSVGFIFVLLFLHIYRYICIALTPALVRARYNTKASHNLCILQLIFLKQMKAHYITNLCVFTK